MAKVAARALRNPTPDDALAFVDAHRELFAAIVAQVQWEWHKRLAPVAASALTQARNKKGD